MTFLSNPAFWSSLSGLTGPLVAMIAAAGLVWALVTGRLVTRRQYDAAVTRAETAEGTNQKLTVALIEKNVSDVAAVNLLGTVRQIAAASGGDS